MTPSGSPIILSVSICLPPGPLRALGKGRCPNYHESRGCLWEIPAPRIHRKTALCLDREVSSGSVSSFSEKPGTDCAPPRGIQPQNKVLQSRFVSQRTEMAGGRIFPHHRQEAAGLPADVPQSGDSAVWLRGRLRPAGVRRADMVARPTAGDAARWHHGCNWHERATRRRPSGNFGPAVDQQTDGYVAGIDRRQFILLALEACRLASHLCQSFRSRYGYRPGHSRPPVSQ